MRNSILRQWRQQQDLTLAEMAGRVGKSLWAYRRIEMGEVKRLDLRTALLIEDVTRRKVRPRDLLPSDEGRR